MTSVPFLDLSRTPSNLRAELAEASEAVIRRGWFVLGPELEAFESEFAAYVGAKHCVGVANGLDALTLTLMAWGIEPGDEVVVPANTYIATWVAVSRCHARLVPVEPDPLTFTMSPSGIEAALSSRTRVLLPVSLYGHPADMHAIMSIAQTADLRVLEDAAQAHGAAVGTRRVGVLADATAWSFYPTKNLGALGDAGAVTTDDDDTAAELRLLRNYGARDKYEHVRLGLNSRLDELQAAVLRVKLKHLDETNSRRKALAARYAAGIAEATLQLPSERTGFTHAWHLYVVRHTQRDRLQEGLAERGVSTLVHYPVPPHLQPAYADLGLHVGSFPITEAIHDQVLSLPLSPHMTDEEGEAVIAAVNETAQQLE